MIAVYPEDVGSVVPLCKSVASCFVDRELQRRSQFWCDLDGLVRFLEIKYLSPNLVKELIGKVETSLLEADRSCLQCCSAAST